MISLRDVAAACGVSLSTASIALRGTGPVAPATRARVLAAAQALGYAPDPMAARLSARRFSNAAAMRDTPIVLASDRKPLALSQLVQRLATRAAELGYQHRHDTLPPNRELMETMLRRWRQQGVAGVVFVRFPLELNAELPEWSHLSLIACDALSEPRCHRVSLNVGDSVTRCWHELRAKGYARIGFAISSHSPPIKDDHERLAAALLIHHQYTPDEQRIPIFTEPLNAHEMPDRLRAWYAAHRPEAVIGFSVIMRYMLEEAGWVCPRDFAFATLHHIPVLAEISGYDTMLDSRATTTIERLDQLIRYRQTGWPDLPEQTLIRSRWVEGRTTPPART